MVTLTDSVFLFLKLVIGCGGSDRLYTVCHQIVMDCGSSGQLDTVVFLIKHVHQPSDFDYLGPMAAFFRNHTDTPLLQVWRSPT